MVWTTAEEVVAAWIGPDAPTDLDAVTLWIEKAERELRFRVHDLQVRLDLVDPELVEPDLADTVGDVVTAMVHRVFRNPEGIRQVGVTTGPFSEQKTYGGDQPGTLYVTSDELERLTATRVAPAAFTIDMIPSTSPFSPNYVPVYPWL